MAADSDENMDIDDMLWSDSDESDFSGFNSDDLPCDLELLSENGSSENEDEDVGPGQWTLNDRSNTVKHGFTGPRPGPNVALAKESREIDFFLFILSIEPDPVPCDAD